MENQEHRGEQESEKGGDVYQGSLRVLVQHSSEISLYLISHEHSKEQDDDGSCRPKTEEYIPQVAQVPVCTAVVELVLLKIILWGSKNQWLEASGYDC